MTQNSIPMQMTTLVDSFYEKLAGQPVPFAVQLISTELLAERPADYKVSGTQKSVRLGILRTFALLAATSQTKGLGIIITKDEDYTGCYQSDRYGTNEISAVNFLEMFGMTVLFGKDIDKVNHADIMQLITTGIGLLIIDPAQFRKISTSSSLMSKLAYPVIEDDGIIAGVITEFKG